MWFDKSKIACELIVPVMMAAVILSCAPSKLAEPEPLPETIVNDLIAKENALWSAFKKKDSRRLGRLLAEEYVAIGDYGPMDKAATIASISNHNISEYSMRDVKATLLGSNYVLLTYRCMSKRDLHGNTFETDYFCADIWVSHGGAWQSIFFEDRPLGERMPAKMAQ